MDQPYGRKTVYTCSKAVQRFFFFFLPTVVREAAVAAVPPAVSGSKPNTDCPIPPLLSGRSREPAIGDMPPVPGRPIGGLNGDLFAAIDIGRPTGEEPYLLKGLSYMLLGITGEGSRCTGFLYKSPWCEGITGPVGIMPGNSGFVEIGVWIP